MQDKNPLETATQLMEKVIQQANLKGMEPQLERSMRLYSTKEACAMLQKSTTSIYKCETEGVIVRPPNKDNGRRVGYSLADINTMRKHFSIKPTHLRFATKPLGATVAVYNFKGGVAKTTTTINMGQYLAINGYKVLLVDMDSQASLTSMFGHMPDQDFEREDTVLRYTLENAETLHDVIRQSHISGLDYIPANQSLASSEFESGRDIHEGGENPQEYLKRLAYGIDTVRRDYDFVIIDAPPSLGIIGIQTLLAVDHIIVPCPARMLDFSSTSQFLSTALTYVQAIDEDKVFKNVTVLTSMLDKRNEKQLSFENLMQAVLGDHIFKNPVLYSEAIDTTSALFQTPWEQEKPDKRITSNMRDVFNEILTMIISKEKTHE